MQESDVPTPRSLLGLGQAWTRIGYAVLLLAVVSLVLGFAVHPILNLAKGAAVPDGYRLIAKGEGAPYLKTTPEGMVAIFLLVFSALAGLAWTFVDIVDRRKRFVWLLPMFVCPFTGLHALPLALYIFFGRETIGHGEGV